MTNKKRGGTAPNLEKSTTTANAATNISDTKIANIGEGTKKIMDFSGANDDRIDGLTNLTCEDADQQEWMNGIERDKNGMSVYTIDNVIYILEHLFREKRNFYKNSFTHFIMTEGGLPWDNDVKLRVWGAVDHSDDACLKLTLQKKPIFLKIGNGSSNGDIDAAMEIVSTRRQVHPIREYLEKLEWDGIKRLDLALHHYLGADTSEYTQAVTRKTLVAACKRVFEPGCKFDYVLTLVGAEGKGKSQFWHILGGTWYSDTTLEFGGKGKDAMEQIRFAWIYEIGDLAGIRKTDAESMKAFISSTNDNYREAYGRRTVPHPRQLIFVATTNNYEFLRSSNGNRRWWVVDIDVCPTKFDDTSMMFQQLEKDRDQLWAEAMYYYRKGELLYLDKTDLEAEAVKLQNTHNEANTYAIGSDIDQYLKIPLPIDWKSRDTDRRQCYYQNIRHDSSIYEKGSVLRTTVIYEEFAYEWYRRDASTYKSDKDKSKFDKVMRKNTDWCQSNPTSYVPYKDNTRVWKMKPDKIETAKAKIEEYLNSLTSGIEDDDDI